nr:helix-turn-helix domain-containing protein [Rathayibacter rathayi]
MRSALPGGANADLLEVLFEEPYCRIRTVMARCGVSRPTARSWLSAMVERGILTETPIGRERLFVNHAFLRLLKRDQETTAGPPAEPTLF